MSKGKNLSISFISYKEKNIIAKPVKNVVAIDRNANKDNILYLDNGFKFRPPSNKKGLILEQLEKKRIKLSKQLTIKYDQNKKLRYDKDNKKWYLTKNYLKLVEKINKVYEKQQNVRKHYNHFATHHITRRYDKVIIEDLDIKKMTESNKGNELLHGKDVKIQSELNRKVLNAALGQNKTYLDYKTKYKGKKLIEIDPKNTSITCTECGNVNKKNRKKRDIFKCIKCGYTNHADFVSAINIKSKS
jgi:IS605 OrfB family transposase